jgi:Rrf2 family protein
MLKLTKKSDYGLIALQHLAQLPRGESASAKEIADRYSIPQPLLSKILQKLARHGFLLAEQGSNGGYRLARDPLLINTFEVIRSLEGPVLTTRCEGSTQACGRRTICTVREPLRRVNERIIELLESIPLAELAERPPQPPLLNAFGQMSAGAKVGKHTS